MVAGRYHQADILGTVVQVEVDVSQDYVRQVAGPVEGLTPGDVPLRRWAASVRNNDGVVLGAGWDVDGSDVDGVDPKLHLVRLDVDVLQVVQHVRRAAWNAPSVAEVVAAVDGPVRRRHHQIQVVDEHR